VRRFHSVTCFHDNQTRLKPEGFGYNVDMVRVEHVLDDWRSVREDTAVAVEEFPAAEFEFRPTPDCSTFRQIARHTLDAGNGLTGALLAGVEDFHLPENRAKIKEYFQPLAVECAPAELAAALRESVDRLTAQLAAQPREFFEHWITRMDGARVTRLEFLQWIKEHELTHRQQLFMYLRLKGMTPATTRRRLARQAAR
jgi:uncharacterized damage-inducible protein DinB